MSTWVTRSRTSFLATIIAAFIPVVATVQGCAFPPLCNISYYTARYVVVVSEKPEKATALDHCVNDNYTCGSSHEAQAAVITACRIAHGACPAATPEICDGLDNDCDDEVDENCSGAGDGGAGGTGSSGGSGGSAGTSGTGGTGGSAGTSGAGGGSMCVATPEICDGLDNDCDGAIDNGNPEGGAACDTGQPGVCATGITECKNTGLVCIQTVLPAAETCDGLDNDCDGVIDEGLNCCSKLGESCAFPKTCCPQFQCVNGTCQ